MGSDEHEKQSVIDEKGLSDAAPKPPPHSAANESCGPV